MPRIGFIVDTSLKLHALMERTFAGATCLALLCAFAGCGAAEEEVAATDRVKASGKVVFDGQPLASGTVTFLNLKSGNVAVCEISDGEYACEAEEGPNPGANTVTVMGTADEKPMWAAPWTANADVGKTDFTQDFTIEKSKVKPYDPKAPSAKGMDEGDTYDVGAG